MYIIFYSIIQKSNRVVSRKITSFVSRVEIDGEDLLLEKAKDFVAQVNAFTAQNCIPDNCIINTDQTKMEYEVTLGRTLSHRGEKLTVARVQIVTSTTTNIQLSSVQINLEN